jgi:hypothetical protein
VRPWGRFESRQPADERFSRDVRWGNLPERWRGTASVQGKPARERRFGDRRAAPRADVRVPTLVLHRRSDRVIPHGRRDGSQPRCRARSSSHSKARRTCRGRAMGTPSLRRSRRSAAFAMRVRIGPSSRSTGRTTTPLSRRCSTGPSRLSVVDLRAGRPREGRGRIPCVSRPLPHRPRLRVPGRVRVRHGGEAVTFGDSIPARSGQLHLALATLPQKVFLPAVQSSNLKSR